MITDYMFLNLDLAEMDQKQIGFIRLKTIDSKNSVAMSGWIPVHAIRVHRREVDKVVSTIQSI